MRKIEVVNKIILEALKRKDEYVEVISTDTDRLEALEAEAKILSARGDEFITKLQREEEKIRPEIDREIAKVELGEWEELSKIYLEKEDEATKGKLFFLIADRLEEEEAKLEKFKIDFKKQKDEPTDNSNTDKEVGEGTSIKDGGDVVLEKAW